jgi:hypothetical protein
VLLFGCWLFVLLVDYLLFVLLLHYVDCSLQTDSPNTMLHYVDCCLFVLFVGLCGRFICLLDRFLVKRNVALCWLLLVCVVCWLFG